MHVRFYIDLRILNVLLMWHESFDLFEEHSFSLFKFICSASDTLHIGFHKLMMFSTDAPISLRSFKCTFIDIILAGPADRV